MSLPAVYENMSVSNGALTWKSGDVIFSIRLDRIISVEVHTREHIDIGYEIKVISEGLYQDDFHAIRCSKIRNDEWKCIEALDWINAQICLWKGQHIQEGESVSSMCPNVP